MERSFAQETAKLTLGEGEIFHGEAILAVAKALLQAGVGYVGGYPGAPVSHLTDVLAESRDTVLEPLGVQFESSASEAGAAALLGASIHYPIRGAVVWKSIVGTNVASDALSNLASAGVTGGALVIVGEDYGEGASVIQERTLATAVKSSLIMLDPRYHMPTLVRLTEQAFELSEAAGLPAVLSLRIRAAHMTGRFVCKNNRPPAFGPKSPLPAPRRDYGRIVLPPSIYAQERAKVSTRLPAACRFIVERALNERTGQDTARFGIILQGGTAGAVLRALRLLGAADVFGRSDVPLLILNVIHPLVPEEITGFLRGKDTVLIVEEGHPPLIEQQVRAMAHAEGIACRIRGKDVLPATGEYVTDVVRAGLAVYLREATPALIGAEAQSREEALTVARTEIRARLKVQPPARPPGFCTGCPERPVFTALKLIERERGPLHISSDIGCNTFATLPPFEIGNTVLGYGLSLASAGAASQPLKQPSIAIMGDGGFWHNGLTTGAVNAHWNGHDSVLVVLENGYASATGQQNIPSTGATPWGQSVRVSIEAVLRAIGVRWLKRVDAYRLRDTLRTLRAALDARGTGLRVVISDRECMLARQRRERPVQVARERAGRAVVHRRFGVDSEVCVGDHSCMRLSGCPSLTLRPTADPMKDGPTAHVEPSCVGCGLCGEIVHAEALCPSFYEARRIANAGPWQRLRSRWAARALAWMGA